MSPWLIVTVGWPADASSLAALMARAATNPVIDATVATTALTLGCGVLLRLRLRVRSGRRSTS